MTKKEDIEFHSRNRFQRGVSNVRFWQSAFRHTAMRFEISNPRSAGSFVMTHSHSRRDRFLKFIDLHVEEAIACCLIVLMAACVLLQVFSRYVYDLGVHWTEEVAAYSMVWAVYLGAVVGIRHHFHIRMLLLVQKLPRALGLPVIVLGDVIWMAFNLLMVFYAVDYLTRLFSFVSLSPALGVEQEWLHSIVLFAYVLMSVRLVQVYAIWIRDGCTGLPAREHEADS